jgi:hypothetical protein
MQARGRGAVRPPVGIALDGDLGNRIDAVLALAMLNGLIAQGDARRISLSVSRSSLKAVQLADVIAGFYAGRTLPGPGGGIGQIREGVIGMPQGGTADDAPPLAAALSKKAADGTPQYTSNINRLLDTAESSVLIRNMLLAQNDENAIIVLAGPATGIARLLALYGSRPQIVAKVRQLMVAIGTFPTGAADPAIAADVAAARTMFAEWPTPLIAVGSEVGATLPYPGSTLDTDMAWSPAHPVADAYRAFKPMPYDAPASALAAVLQAVHPDDGYFTVSPPGTISVLDDGRTQFTAGADGRHHYLIVDPAQKDRITKLYKDMVCAPPAPRPGRGRAAAAPAP